MKVPRIKLYQRGREGIYWVRYSWRGKREHYSLGTMDDNKAMESVNKIKMEMELGIHCPQRKMIFDNIWERYKKEEWPDKRPSSRRRDQTSIQFLRLEFGGKAINEETFREQARAYRCKRLDGKLNIEGVSQKDKVSNSTVNREITLLKRIINLAVYEWRVLRTNPLEKFSMLKETPRNRLLTPEEWLRLLDASSPELQDFMIMARFTGIRHGLCAHGILDLKWSDINLDDSKISVRGSKNGEGRIVYMNEMVHKMLSRRKAQAVYEYVFPGKNGKRRSSFSKAFDNTRKRVQLIDIRIHDFRHLFGMDKKSEGADLPSLAKIMGHKDIKTTMRYGEPDEEHLRKIMKSKPKRVDNSGPSMVQMDDQS